MRRPILLTLTLALSLPLSLAGCPNSEEPDPPDSGVADSGTPDSGATDSGTADAGVVASCPAPNGATIEHGADITADETWAGDGTTHVISQYFTVRPPATLTIEPCALVQGAADRSITVRGDSAQNMARLIARGTADRPIRFERRDPAVAWGGIRGYNAFSFIDLAYVTIDGGGSTTTNSASLEIYGENLQAAPSQVGRVDHVTISRSKGYGVVLSAAAAFTADSTDLTITESGEAANAAVMSLTIHALGTLPSGSYTGNLKDVIRVEQSLSVTSDLTVRDPGVPIYFVFGRVQVVSLTAPYPPVTLTFEPGCELQFDDYISFGSTGGAGNNVGVLRAIGTAADPITFTSSKDTKAAGDWPGIWLRTAPGSLLDHVIIEYAGAFNGIISNNCKPPNSTDYGALIVGNSLDVYVPAADIVQNTEIRDSAAHGVNAMWLTAGFGPDLTAGITFNRIVGCSQTRNGTPTGCNSMEGCQVD